MIFWNFHWWTFIDEWVLTNNSKFFLIKKWKNGLFRRVFLIHIWPYSPPILCHFITYFHLLIISPLKVTLLWKEKKYFNIPTQRTYGLTDIFVSCSRWSYMVFIFLRLVGKCIPSLSLQDIISLGKQTQVQEPWWDCS